MEYKTLTKKEKLTLLSIVFDLNKLGEKVSATLNPFDWMNITIGTTEDLKVMTVGGAYGLSFDDAIKSLNKLTLHQVKVLNEK